MDDESFQQLVIDKLARIETKVETMSNAYAVSDATIRNHESRITVLETNNKGSSKWVDDLRGAAISGGIAGAVSLIVFWITPR